MFDFVIQAWTSFNHWSLQTKKEILRWLGWNFWLKDWKLLIDEYKWFIPIKKLSSEIKREKHPLELIKNSTVKGLTSAKNTKIG